MRNFKIENSALLSTLLLSLVVVGCSSGSGGTTGTGGTAGAGSGGAAGAGSGGAAGSGSGSGGAAGAGSGGAAGSGSGGTVTTDGGTIPAGPSVCDGTATRILALDQGKVDNFEGAALSPGWATFNDVMPVMNAIKMTQESGGAAGTAKYGKYAGMGARTPVMGGFGVGAIYNLAIDKTAGFFCVDVSAFTGVSFWAKAATTGSKVSVNFVVPETNAKADDGDCLAACYVHPSKSISLTTTWAQYTVTFAEAIGGTAKVKGKLQLLGFLSPDSNWDFSIDEIQLYSGATAPTGPVATPDGGI